MFYRYHAVAAILLSVTTLAPVNLASAADLDGVPVKASPIKAKPIIDIPFFFVNDNRITYSWMPNGTYPGNYTIQPGASVNGNTAKSVYSFTHFDAWAYGTNSFSISMFKSDHNDPAAPCSNAGVLASGVASNCAGASEFYGSIRSTLGWNEIFNTKAFSVGPLRNISFEVGADAESDNTNIAPAKRNFDGGLQFAFALPYEGYFNVAPMVTKQFMHLAIAECGVSGPGIPGTTCLADGNVDFNTTWTVETNYYMDLGFLPEGIRFFSVSGRAAWTGPKGGTSSPEPVTGVGRLSTATVTEFNSEPIRLTFDAGKAFAGPKYSHFVDVWVGYRYWQNKYGYNHNAAPGVCTVAATGQSTNSCTESTVYTGVTMKF